MRFIPSAFHGILDYAVAATLIAGPLLLGFQGVALVLAIAGGAGLLVYSLITDYSMSARNLLPFKTHLMLDFAAAAFLVVAPFLFGFSGITQAFYQVICAAVIAVVFMTKDDTQVARTA